MKTRMTIISIVMVSMLTVPLGTMAQSYVGGSGMVNAGYMWTPASSSSLRSFTGKSAGLPKGYATIGTEINYRNGSSVVVISACLGMHKGILTDGKFIEPIMWKTSGGFGRMIFRSNSLFVYPVLEIGVLESSLIYHNNSDSDIREVNRSFSLGCNLHTDYFLNHDDKAEGFFSVTMVSVRLGYTNGLSAHELNGFHLAISLGGLSFLKHKQLSKI